MGRTKGGKNAAGYRASDPEVATLEEVGQALGVTRERARQIEKVALQKVKAKLVEIGIDEQLWLSHLADLHRRQKTVFTVSTEYVSAGRFRSVDEAEQAACSSHAAE